MTTDVDNQKEAAETSSLALTKGMEMMIAGFIPNTRYFDSRFDLLQVQVDFLRKGQEDIKSQMEKRFEQSDQRLNEFKIQVDKRFEQVDKRFEQVDKRFEQVDKRFEQVDKRFEQVDKRFEQMIASIDKLSEKLDQRDERSRAFTIRMFSIAITLSFIGTLGVMLKVFGIV